MFTTGRIIFTNTVSEPDDSTKDNSKDDFNSALITEYYQGRKIEGGNKGMKNVKKRLYIDDDVLMGEVTFDFDDITKLGFYRYKGEGPPIQPFTGSTFQRLRVESALPR